VREARLFDCVCEKKVGLLSRRVRASILTACSEVRQYCHTNTGLNTYNHGSTHSLFRINLV
jgi:hypothetical protein